MAGLYAPARPLPPQRAAALVAERARACEQLDRAGGHLAAIDQRVAEHVARERAAGLAQPLEAGGRRRAVLRHAAAVELEQRVARAGVGVAVHAALVIGGRGLR